MANCISSNDSSECWLIDSDCTNNMTHDRDIFKELKQTNTSRVRIGNGEYLVVEGNGRLQS